MNKWLNLGRHGWTLYWYHPSALSPIIFLFHLNVSSSLSVLYLWQITVSSLTIKSTVAPRDCGSCYPDSKVEETLRHHWAVQEPLEVQSRSISLSSAMVVPPENLNEKHFAAEFADFAWSALFFFFLTGAEWQSASGICSSKWTWVEEEVHGSHLTDLKLTSFFSSFFSFSFMAEYYI